MRFILGAAFAALLLVPVASQAQSWQEYRPKGAGFRIEMPGDLKLEDKGGKPATYSAVSVVGKDKVFLVNYRDQDDLKLGLDTMLDAVVEGQSDGKKVVSIKKEKLGAYPARRVRLKDSDNDEYEIRVVIADRRLIQAIFVGTDGDPLGRRFLDSFVILEP